MRGRGAWRGALKLQLISGAFEHSVFRSMVASTPGPTEFVGPGSRRHVA